MKFQAERRSGWIIGYKLWMNAAEVRNAAVNRGLDPEKYGHPIYLHVGENGLKKMEVWGKNATTYTSVPPQWLSLISDVAPLQVAHLWPLCQPAHLLEV